MRVTSLCEARTLLANLDRLNTDMETANLQIATGKKLLSLKDSPAGSAEVIGLRDELSRIDQFQSNTDSLSYILNTTDSALERVTSVLTEIFTKASAVASGTATASTRATTEADIRSLRGQVLSLANSQARGRYIFAGSQTLSAPFALAGDTITYNGDQDVNTVEIESGVRVQQNVPGSGAFTPVFDAINGVLTALHGGDTAALRSALGQFSSVLTSVGQVRANVGADLGRLETTKTALDTATTNAKTRRSTIEDANLAEAVTELTRIKTAFESLLTAQSIAQKNNLFDFLA
jgi:flagellar hook-associated protein 3 FlgL